MTTQTLVLGGGYAGVLAANRLLKRDDVAVTLVNARPHFVERIRLHQFAAGNHTAVETFEHVLNPRVRVVVDEAERIDAARRLVSLREGGEVAYDWLVYAVGSRPAAGVPGVAEHAFTVGTFEDATALRAALVGRPDASVVVVGGGPTGVETAAELAEQGRTVTLVARTVVVPYFQEPGRRALRKRLARLGVTVLDGVGAARVEPGAVVLDDGRTVPSGITVWAAGFEPADLATRSGLTTDPSGRLLTDETLTSIDSDRIVAAGDAASPSGVPERMSCQSAGPLAVVAAETVLARLAGREPAALANPFLAQCVSLGRHGAVAQFAHTDDTARRLYLSGRAGARLKELACKGALAGLVGEARRPGFTPNVRAKGRARVLAAAQAAQAVAETAAPAGDKVVA